MARVRTCEPHCARSCYTLVGEAQQAQLEAVAHVLKTYPELIVFLQVLESNVGAVAFYEKLGFERTETMYLVRFEL